MSSLEIQRARSDADDIRAAYQAGERFMAVATASAAVIVLAVVLLVQRRAVVRSMFSRAGKDRPPALSGRARLVVTFSLLAIVAAMCTVAMTFLWFWNVMEGGE